MVKYLHTWSTREGMKVVYSVQKYKYHSARGNAYPRDTTHLPTPRKIYQDCPLYVKICVKIANFDKVTLLLVEDADGLKYMVIK